MIEETLRELFLPRMLVVLPDLERADIASHCKGRQRIHSYGETAWEVEAIRVRRPVDEETQVPGSKILLA